MTEKELFSEIPLFSGLSVSQLDQIRSITVEKTYKKGQFIFSEGDDGNGFYVVSGGQVKIFKLSPDGKEQILHIYGPGNPFGEVPVFSGKRFPANALALVKSRVLFFPRTDFIGLLSANPSLAMNMLAELSLRLRQFTVQIESLSLKEVPGRLASYLTYLSREQGDSDLLELQISKGQLASLLGTIPETLSRIFAKMTEQGLIRVDGRAIEVLDREGLADLAAYGRLA